MSNIGQMVVHRVPKTVKKDSVAATVRQYIDRRPVVRDALAMGIINLSALSRQIMDATGITQEEAVLVACRRYTTPEAGYEKDIRELLDKSRLEVRTRVSVWTLRPGWRLFSRLERALPRLQDGNTPVHILHASEAIVIIADDSMQETLNATLDDEDVLSIRSGLVEVNLRTPSSVKDVPGMLAFISSSLSARGVNFVEVISCHKDNMFVIEEDDLFEAFEVLNALVQG